MTPIPLESLGATIGNGRSGNPHFYDRNDGLRDGGIPDK